jgi:hypothetical protein
VANAPIVHGSCLCSGSPGCHVLNFLLNKHFKHANEIFLLPEKDSGIYDHWLDRCNGRL